jgi:hypothetical protein
VQATCYIWEGYLLGWEEAVMMLLQDTRGCGYCGILVKAVVTLLKATIFLKYLYDSYSLFSSVVWALWKFVGAVEMGGIVTFVERLQSLISIFFLWADILILFIDDDTFLGLCWCCCYIVVIHYGMLDGR